MSSSQLVEISGHLINLCVVVVLQFFNELRILGQHKVYRRPLFAESTCSTNSVNVVLFRERKFVIDDETNLLNIDSSCK